MLLDYRKFSITFKKIPIEFLIYKDSFPMRIEALTYLNIILSFKNQFSTIVFDEAIKSIKKNKIIPQEMMVIKNYVKGEKISAVMMMFSIIHINECSDLIKEYEGEGIGEYLDYCIKKDQTILKRFPEVKRFINLNQSN